MAALGQLPATAALRAAKITPVTCAITDSCCASAVSRWFAQTRSAKANAACHLAAQTARQPPRFAIQLYSPVAPSTGWHHPRGVAVSRRADRRPCQEPRACCTTRHVPQPEDKWQVSHSFRVRVRSTWVQDLPLLVCFPFPPIVGCDLALPRVVS